MAKLPSLPYDYDALEPHIDKETMTIHHTKHHQAYVDNFNKAVAGTELEGEDVDSILVALDSVPEKIRGVVRNNGGGHSNHSKFWKMLCPASESGKPSDVLKAAIDKKFGSFDKFKEEFTKAAMTRFGSGWAWLVVSNGELEVTSTANQDSPLSSGQMPVLGLDVWEHGYYISYTFRRADYIKAWWNIVNWKKISENYEKAMN